MLVSGVQQSDLVIHIHIFLLFQILFPHKLLQNIEYSFLRYTIDPCWLSALHVVVCICQSQPPNSSPSPISPLVSTSLPSKSMSLFLFSKLVHLHHFFRFHACDIIWYLSFSDLLHLVWSSLCPSMLLQMTLCHCVLWLRNIPLYTCTTSSLSIIPLLMDT